MISCFKQTFLLTCFSDTDGGECEKGRRCLNSSSLSNFLSRKFINLILSPSAVDDNNAISWAGSDRDYTYDELLNRVFDIILEKNPDMAAGRKPKFVMRPPQVLRVGTKKTSFANFTEICKTLHR